jgi:hypothetical protein
MSAFGKRILEARARFHLLRSIHSLFDASLPTTDDVESGRYGALSEDELADLEDDITLLRSDIKSLPIKLQQIDIEQISTDVDIDRLIKAFDYLLTLFENSVLDLTEAETSVATSQVCIKSTQI